MGVKGYNLEINSGLFLSSFILNYMTIRVKDKRVGIRKRERTESEERNDREERRTQGKQRFGKVDFLITILRWG